MRRTPQRPVDVASVLLWVGLRGLISASVLVAVLVAVTQVRSAAVVVPVLVVLTLLIAAIDMRQEWAEWFAWFRGSSPSRPTDSH